MSPIYLQYQFYPAGDSNASCYSSPLVPPPASLALLAGQLHETRCRFTPSEALTVLTHDHPHHTAIHPHYPPHYPHSARSPSTPHYPTPHYPRSARSPSHYPPHYPLRTIALHSPLSASLSTLRTIALHPSHYPPHSAPHDRPPPLTIPLPLRRIALHSSLSAHPPHYPHSA